MKIKSIWTIRGMGFRERIDLTKEWVWRSLASRLPKRIAYWSFIYTGLAYTSDHEVINQVGFAELLKRMDNK